MKPVEGLILDFDGTLAPGVPEVAIGVLHRMLTQWCSVSQSFVREYFRAVSAFRMDRALQLLLESLGLLDKAGEIAKALNQAERHGAWTVELDEGAAAFLAARRPGTVKIFSSAGSQAARFAPLTRLLAPEDFLAYPELPKADPETWSRVARDLAWTPYRVVVVDDSPLALLAAKAAGFITVLRTNSVFTAADGVGIDHCVESMAALGRRFLPR